MRIKWKVHQQFVLHYRSQTAFPTSCIDTLSSTVERLHDFVNCSFCDKFLAYYNNTPKRLYQNTSRKASNAH